MPKTTETEKDEQSKTPEKTKKQKKEISKIMKNEYRKQRIDANLSVEGASDALSKSHYISDYQESIEPHTIRRLEAGERPATPLEVLAMEEVYNAPDLCHYYCSEQCPIGKKYNPKIEIKEFRQIVIEMVLMLNSLQEKKNRLMEIAINDAVDQNEETDFAEIQKKLNQMAILVDSLQYWAHNQEAEKKRKQGQDPTTKNRYRKTTKQK